jgi:antitoxin CcdA
VVLYPVEFVSVGPRTSWEWSYPRSCAIPSANCALAKSATDVSIRRDLVEAARAAKINLSATLELALIEKLREAQQRQWREENSESIAVYNHHVEKHCVFCDGS